MAIAVASPARFERATFRLGGGCSIQLSYGDIIDGVILSNLAGTVKHPCENVSPKFKFPLYRKTGFGYNKLNYVLIK